MRYPHGTHAAYSLDRCRCTDCRAAHSAYARARARQIEPAYVSAGPARSHLAELAAAGIGLKQVAKVSGVSHGALSKLVYGMPDRAPSKRIRHSTHEAIMAVSPRDIADGSRVASGPTWVRIREMVAAGVPRVRIAEAIGQTGALQLRGQSVTVGHARAIAGLHADWKAGRVVVTRRHRHGDRQIHPPVQVQVRREPADISDLLTALAEAVELRNSQPWRQSAACRNRPGYLWFPARGDVETMKAGIRVCMACTVRDRCRAEMFTEPVGVYGGLPARRRRQIQREDDVA